MSRPILLATLAMLTATVLSAQQESKPPERPDTQQRETGKSDASALKSLKTATEKAVDGVGEALEKTDEAVKEALDLSRTGCLTQGDEADPFILTDKESGDRITVVGSPDLPKHVGHTVTIHGGKESDGRVFHATKVEHVSAACDDSAAQTRPAVGYRPESRDTDSASRPQNKGVTADDQGLNAADRKTTQAIRKAVTADDTLSIYAKNVKIVTRDGLVTLRGPVRSAEEKQSIEAKAAAVAGAANVTNELTVEPAGANR